MDCTPTGAGPTVPNSSEDLVPFTSEVNTQIGRSHPRQPPPQAPHVRRAEGFHALLLRLVSTDFRSAAGSWRTDLARRCPRRCGTGTPAPARPPDGDAGPPRGRFGTPGPG